MISAQNDRKVILTSPLATVRRPCTEWVTKVTLCVNMALPKIAECFNFFTGCPRLLGLRPRGRSVNGSYSCVWENYVLFE